MYKAEEVVLRRKFLELKVYFRKQKDLELTSLLLSQELEKVKIVKPDEHKSN